MSRQSRAFEDGRSRPSSSRHSAANQSVDVQHPKPPVHVNSSSVNEANAFSLARSDAHLTMTTSTTSYLTDSEPVKETHNPPPKPSLNRKKMTTAAERAKSPVEIMTGLARALSPLGSVAGSSALEGASYILREAPRDSNGDRSRERDYASFSGLGESSGEKSANEYSYDAEEREFQRRRAQCHGDQRTPNGRSKKNRHSNGGNDNSAWRPEEGESDPDTEEVADQGIGAHLGERENRGIRTKKGEGYLGLGKNFETGARRHRQPRKVNGDGEMVTDDDADSINEEVDPSPRRRSTAFRGRGVARSGTATSSRTRGGTYAEEQARFTPRPRTSKERSEVPEDNIHQHESETPRYHTVPAESTMSISRLLGMLFSTISNLTATPTRAVKTVLRSIDATGFGGMLKWAILLPLCVVIVFKYLEKPAEHIHEPATWIPRSRPTSRGWSTPFPSDHAPRSPVDDTVDSIDGLAGRMSELENAVSSLSYQSAETSRLQSTSNSQLDDVRQRLTQIDREIEIKLAKVSERSELGIDELRAIARGLRSEIESLSSQFGKHTTKSSSDIVSIRDHVDRHARDVETRMLTMSRQVNALEADVKLALSQERFVDVLEHALPDFIPVASRNGVVTIAPIFWAELKRVLASRDEPPSQTPNLAHSVTWSDFIADNREAVSTWTRAVVDTELEAKHLIDRNEFTEVLERELYKLRREVTSKSNGKVTHAGSDITSVLSAMIDQALLTYSKDTIARADFALASAGGQIIPELTSPTLVLQRPRLWRSILLGSAKVAGRDPLTILWGETSPGICWPFDGAQGQVGIAFATKVKVTDITIDHVAQELVTKDTMGSAPRDVEVWMPIEPEQKEAITNYLNIHPDHRDLSISPPSRSHFLLTTLTYLPSSTPIQTFPIPSDIVKMGLFTDNVLVRVRSNWGGAYTCVYRVRIHGQAIEDVSNADDETIQFE